ncbi:glycosyltransferase [Vibrio parahaemolyticus]|uniref:glycosyltransferase n=1 Tax=Vibrio campbellii TaxID=680 RepID=UPI00039D2C68|nr:glycosyltransferase [Vibrio campbellii]MDF5669197.1 glycosyltransferase [Vibrio parahaemolyticus]MDG2729298.1 glycosyltransferase [Vibrio parahaemolyticus]
MHKQRLAPVIIFAFNRITCLKNTIESLKNNQLSDSTDVIIFSDGPRRDSEKEVVQSVRDYLKTIDGFSSVTIYEANKNKGLGASIIEGVTQIIEQYGKAIVLEDDLVSSSSFLKYMNEALDLYESHDEVFSISGFSPKLELNLNKDETYFANRISSLGWGTWKNRWDTIDWSISSYRDFMRSKEEKRKFSEAGRDMLHMLINQVEGSPNSWAIRFDYNRYLSKNGVTLYPVSSRISHIGNDGSGTNVKKGEEKFFYAHLENIDKNKFAKTGSDTSAINKKFRSYYGFSFKSLLAIYLRRLGILEWLKKLQ